MGFLFVSIRGRDTSLGGAIRKSQKDHTMNATLNATPETSTASLITDEQAEQLGQDEHVNELANRLAIEDLFEMADSVELVDDQIEAEKSKLRETVARLEITVRTQAENIAAYQKSLLECNDQCERKAAQLTDAKARIENHVAQHVEYERYVAELDAKHLDLTKRLDLERTLCEGLIGGQRELQSQLKTVNTLAASDSELIADAKRGIKYTGIMLAIIVVLAGLYRCEGEPVRSTAKAHVVGGAL